MANRTIAYFLEDIGHEQMIRCLVRRILDERSTPSPAVAHQIRNARNGNQLIPELRHYLRDLKSSHLVGDPPDLLVVTRDTNTVGRVRRERELARVINPATCAYPYILALPDPYIEAWFFADPQALKRALGLQQPPTIPTTTGDRNRYKRALQTALATIGVRSRLGGVEYAEDIVAHMDLYVAERSTPSLKQFIVKLREAFVSW